MSIQKPPFFHRFVLQTIFVNLTMAFAATVASAQTVDLNPSDRYIDLSQAHSTVVGAKYRLSGTNFDQSLDSGGGTNLANGQPTFVSSQLGNIGQLSPITFDFSLRHIAGQGFLFSLGNSTLSWGTFSTTPAGTTAALLPRTGDGTLIAPGASFNSLIVEAYAQHSGGSTVTFQNLNFTAAQGVTVNGSLSNGFISNTATQIARQDIISDTSLSTFNWELTGQVRATRVNTGAGGDESVKFVINGKNGVVRSRNNSTDAIPEPATLPLLLPILGIWVRRYRSS